MADLANQFRAPFAEQIEYFRQKLPLPSERWDDIRGAAHDRAVIVAGAAKADLLQDLVQAIDKTIADGVGLEAFRKDFAAIIRRTGWDYTGAFDWRTRVIYQTNLSTSYAAGRWAQLNEPAFVKAWPYWKYVHADGVAHPRPLHVSWHGVVLHHTDPWWQTHYTPNGWGCHCRVVAASKSEYDAAPADRKSAPQDGTWIKIDAYGTEHVIPAGIDYGFAHAPGANVKTPLREIIDQKLIRLDAPIGAAMMRELGPLLRAERGAAYREWLHAIDADDRAKSITPIVGAIDPLDLAWLAQSGKPTPDTAEIGISSALINGPKALRHQAKGDALPDGVWDYLPEMLETPLAVLFDEAHSTLIYVLPEMGARRPQLVVEFDYKRRNRSMNMLISAYRPRLQNILQRIGSNDDNDALTLIRGNLVQEGGE